jgi:hypothetical protein
VISPKGHIVTDEGDPGATSSLVLHNPNGTTEEITGQPFTHPVADVNARGVVIGTNRNSGSALPYSPWVYRQGALKPLGVPTSTDDFVAAALNRSGATVGVRTNARAVDPTKTDYRAVPQLWATIGSMATDLPVPNAGYYVVAIQGRPLIDIRADGLISAVLDNHAGTRYLARWNDPGSQPSLVQLPAGIVPMATAGRWVIAQTGPGTVPQDVLVFSPADAVVLDAPNALSAVHITGNGTYVITYGNGSVYGRGLGTPLDGAQYYTGTDVVSAQQGMASVATATGVSTLTCALGLQPATYITVNSWP